MPDFSGIPLGSTLERVYYAVPAHYTIGEEHETFVSAVRSALTKRHADMKQLLDRPDHLSMEYISDVTKIRCVVDCRWVMRHPNGDATDMAVERTNVADWTIEQCDRVEERNKKCWACGRTKDECLSVQGLCGHFNDPKGIEVSS